MTHSAQTRDATPGPESLVHSVWEKIGTHLESARLRVQEEIQHYPPPIPACDAHFNYLLAQRARIGEELNRMHKAAGTRFATEDAIRQIKEFLMSSNCMSDETKREIRSCLDNQESEAPAHQ